LVIKKARIDRPFFKIAGSTSASAVRKGLNKTHQFKWVVVTCVRKSYRVGISDPQRSDFPVMGISVFSNHTIPTNSAGVNLRYCLYQT
jgi:hypothetical protein